MKNNNGLMTCHLFFLCSLSPNSMKNKKSRKKICLNKKKKETLQNFIKVIDYVGPLVDQLDIHIERRLRRQLEQREIELNKEYLKDFEQVEIRIE